MEDRCGIGKIPAHFDDGIGLQRSASTGLQCSGRVGRPDQEQDLLAAFSNFQAPLMSKLPKIQTSSYSPGGTRMEMRFSRKSFVNNYVGEEKWLIAWCYPRFHAFGSY